MTTIPAIDPHSEEDSGEDATQLVLELALWHQMSTFSAHELVHLGNNFKTVAVWISDNIRPLSAARRKDDNADWYFPLLFRKSVELTPAAADDDISSSRSKTCSWSGIHHSSGEIHQLFPLAHLPPDWIRYMRDPRNDIIASSGGLLLITQIFFREPGDVREFRQIREFQRRRHATTSQNWKPLLVSNPLTRKWRVLPAPYCRDVGVTSWEYGSLRAFMVADDEANSYKVILIFTHFVCVYKSTCNSWVCRVFPEPRPWGSIGADSVSSYVGASACVGGRLHFADMEVRGSVLAVYCDDIDIRGHGFLRVFEFNDEAGTWKPPIRYALRDFFLQNPDTDHGFRLGSYAFDILECMGSMFAVIPAELDMLVTVEEMRQTYDGDDLGMFLGFMPLQFHILRLQGEAGLAQGILRIHIPDIPISSIQRMRSLSERLTRNPHVSMFHNASWFRCTARGSVIWVTWDEYLLQYDVLSGQSKTRVLPDTSFADAPDFAYRPSFDMKP